MLKSKLLIIIRICKKRYSYSGKLQYQKFEPKTNFNVAYKYSFYYRPITFQYRFSEYKKIIEIYRCKFGYGQPHPPSFI